MAQRLTIAWLMKPKFSLILLPPALEMQEYISDAVKKDYNLKKEEIDRQKRLEEEKMTIKIEL